jgi:hypothetical protein
VSILTKTVMYHWQEQVAAKRKSPRGYHAGSPRFADSGIDDFCTC